MPSDVLPWLEYRWSFDFPAGMYRAVVERLRGTPARLEELLSGVGSGPWPRRNGEGWSLKEQVGHFVSVEALWQRRVDEYRRGVAVLTAADMTNRATANAGYDTMELAAVLQAFRHARAQTVATLDPLTLDEASRTAHHPRLERPLRLVDLCFFAAEHDDHHLAAITSLLRSGAQQAS